MKILVQSLAEAGVLRLMYDAKRKWQNVFYSDVKNKIRVSKQEFNNYKMSGRVISLQQACGKLFSVVENYLMIKYNKRKRSYRSLWDLAKSNRDDTTLLQLAKQLHVFFYNGNLDMRLFEAEGIYMNVYNRMISRLRSKGRGYI